MQYSKTFEIKAINKDDLNLNSKNTPKYSYINVGLYYIYVVLEQLSRIIVALIEKEQLIINPSKLLIPYIIMSYKEFF